MRKVTGFKHEITMLYVEFDIIYKGLLPSFSLIWLSSCLFLHKKERKYFFFFLLQKPGGNSSFSLLHIVAYYCIWGWQSKHFQVGEIWAMIMEF